MKYEEIAKRIIEASKNNSLTFFVGAGVSKCSGIPLWGELIEKICGEMKIEVPESLSADDYLRIPQMFYYTCNDPKKYSGFVSDTIDKPNAAPNEVHRLMLKFHPASFITTNYDHLLESAAVEYGQSYKSVVEDKEVASINGDRFILKVHGDIEHNNFVLREEDYLAYEDKFRLVVPLMRSVFSTNTVVFIGYRIGDYNVKLILDGVRRALKEKFKPIFIRVEEEPLRDEEQKYYESRGLNVIEFSKVTTPEERALIREDDYVARYSAVLEYISVVTKEKLLGETEEESFSNLYNCLEPLDKLSALRISDIQERLSDCCSISNMGTVYFLNGMEGLFGKFISIHELPANERNGISGNDYKRYRLILRVLNKGQVYRLKIDHRIIDIYDERISFADDRCIAFDYSSMASYCKSDYKVISAKFKKAFYLTRLNRYEDAFDLFLEIAKESFRSKDYVHFYLARINCIALRSIFKNPLIRFDKDEILREKEDKLILWETENALFDSLPQEFKNEYKSLRELCTKEFLYQYSFSASNDAKKLEKTLAARTIEFGETSSGRVISRVNEYLHFLLGNGVCLDVFTEYKSSVCTLMEKLIQKYADQQHKTLIASGLSFETENKILFDQYDFYCFIRFFNSSELGKALKDNKCKIIKFENMECIESAIHNLLLYAERMIRDAKTRIELDGLFGEIESFLTLARYMTLSEKMVEEICRYIFKYNIGYITIDKKVLFLYSQVLSRHITNNNIQKILEDALIKYLDERLKAISEGTEWNSYSKTSAIDYPNIADYIDIDNMGIVSRRLSSRVSRIIDKRVVQMQNEVVDHYYNHISEVQKKRLCRWIENMLIENFEFDRFVLLMQIDRKKAKTLSDNLILYLEKVEKRSADTEQSGIEIYPKPIPHNELLNVGLWCMCGFLDSKKYFQFKGIEPEYDFLIDAMNFDYTQFDTGWLLKMSRYALDVVTKRKTVKNKLLNIILNEIKKDELKQKEKDSLVRLLGDHFSN